jgi:hypothetical protein
MTTPPRSAYDMTSGMCYFARMLDKIRLHARGELPPDYHSFLGRGADGWCVTYLRVNYEALRERVLASGTDEEILQWCFENGRKLEETDLFIWNSFAKKLGWNDVASSLVQRLKRKSGLAERDDIVTMFDYFDADEGRVAGGARSPQTP